MKSAIDEKMELLYRSPNQFVTAFGALAESIIKVDDDAVRRRTAKLAQLIGETMQLADAMGRKRLLMEFDAKGRRGQPPRFRSLGEVNYFMTTPVVPHVPFTEAYEDILRREPRIAKNRDEIARAYSGDNGFAIMRLPARLADAAKVRLLQRVQKALADFAARGESTASVSKKLASLADFTRSYAETVYRTNLATAFTAGRMRQMQDPDVEDVTPAFELVGVHDGDERPNHRAGCGTIAGIRHPIWDLLAPPLGYNCRHDLRAVDRFELKRLGLWTKGMVIRPRFPTTINAAGPDPGFRVTRTDKRVYGFKAIGSEAVAVRPWMIYAA